MINQRNRIKEQCEEESVSMFAAMMEQIHRKKEAHQRNTQPEKVILYSHASSQLSQYQIDEEKLLKDKKDRKALDLLKKSAKSSEQYQALISDIKEGDSDGLYLVDSGKGRITNPYDGADFGLVQRGDFFGESNFLKCPVSITQFYVIEPELLWRHNS